MPPATKQAAFDFGAPSRVTQTLATAPSSPAAAPAPPPLDSESPPESEPRRRPPQCKGDPCLYCDMPLLSVHEHDHFPIPYRHGGAQTFCVCHNCHDLKDRVPFGKLSLEFGLKALFDLWPKLTPKQRITLAKIIACMTDGIARTGRPVVYEDEDEESRFDA
jgi:hypothetical protein